MHEKNLTLTADVIIEFDDGSIVLIKRKNEPFQGQWALPGGILDVGETIEATAIREAEEETGLKVQLQELIGVYSEPDRDPRGRFVTVAYRAKPIGGEMKADSDAADILRTDSLEEMPLAFDHNRIITDYLKSKKY